MSLATWRGLYKRINLGELNIWFWNDDISSVTFIIFSISFSVNGMTYEKKIVNVHILNLIL